MAKGPEGTFIARVHRNLSDKIYREKMHNAYRGGTPDVWYSGAGGDLWVEYKWAKGATIDLRGLTPLQRDWILARQREGRRAIAAVGWRDGVFVYGRGLNLEFTVTFEAYVKLLEGWCG